MIPMRSHYNYLVSFVELIEDPIYIFQILIINGIERFIQQKYIRILHHSLDQREALLHSKGERPDFFAALFIKLS